MSFINTSTVASQLLLDATKQAASSQLRTKEQLGYIVQAGSTQMNGVLGYTLRIQVREKKRERGRERERESLYTMYYSLFTFSVQYLTFTLS